MERPASPPRPHEEAEIDFDDEEEDPEEVEPWFTSSSDSEPEREPKRPAPPPTPSPAPAWTEPEQQPAPITAEAEADKKGDGEEDARPRWPGWPGASVFRLVVPADKIGGVIGRRGETIKRLCDETRARVRVLDAPLGASSQIVRLPLLPSAKFCFVPVTGFYGLYL
jgi:poly(rC)-binding protein 2/3/4